MVFFLVFFMLFLGLGSPPSPPPPPLRPPSPTPSPSPPPIAKKCQLAWTPVVVVVVLGVFFPTGWQAKLFIASSLSLWGWWHESSGGHLSCQAGGWPHRLHCLYGWRSLLDWQWSPTHPVWSSVTELSVYTTRFCVKPSQVVYFRTPSGDTWKNISERTSGMTRQ